VRLYAGDLYWDKTFGEPFAFDKITEPEATRILIVGGGMSGSLCAFVLSSHGIPVTVIEKNKIGRGSSAANTGLLQYRSDKMLCEFADTIGEEKAVQFYRMCLEAMDQLTWINGLLRDQTGYRLKDSIYYASGEEDGEKLHKEYNYLLKYDFPVEFLDQEELKNKYGINKPCALRTWHDADVNPFRFIQALTRQNLKQGVKYYEETELDLKSLQGNTILTKDGFLITFEHLVLATGYTRIYPVIKGKGMINRTYALCSKPFITHLWKDAAMVWETKNPYLYFRATEDHRIIAGGLDETIDIVEEDEAKIMLKAKEITGQIQEVFPNLEISIDHAWSALFGSSRDGLPFIGKDPRSPNHYYLLGYEGNGTCYSMAGALILKDLILGKVNPYQDIVRVDRQ